MLTTQVIQVLMATLALASAEVKPKFIFARMFHTAGFQADLKVQGFELDTVKIGIQLDVFNEGFFRPLKWGAGIWQYPSKEAEALIIHVEDRGEGRKVYSIDFPAVEFPYIQNLIKFYGAQVYLVFEGTDPTTGRRVQGSAWVLDGYHSPGATEYLSSLRHSRERKVLAALAREVNRMTIGINYKREIREEHESRCEDFLTR